MGRYMRLVVLGLTVLVFGACASDGTFENPFAETKPVSGSGYFFSEFPDIPIPNDMSESRDETFITFVPSGVKCGTQRFSGRLESVSLMNAMRRNMANNGWSLRSVLRAKESSMVFEKPDRIATFQISDGLVFTEMRLFVSSRLQGDSGTANLGNSAPAVSASAAPSGQQKLAQ